MNIQQTRNAQNAIRAAIAICEAKGGIEAAVSVANSAWVQIDEAYPLPVGEYRRYSWLMADLTRMQVQLADQLRDLEFAAGLPVDEETGADLREHSGNSIAADHAEALELNELRDFRIDAPEPEQVARTASTTRRLQHGHWINGYFGSLQSHIIAPVFILLMLLIGGSFNADAMMAGMLGSTMANLDSVEPVDSLKPAVPVEHWVCGGQQVSYDGKSLTVDGWRFTRPLEVVKKQPSVTRAVGFENTNRQIVMLITVEGTTIFAGDYYPEVTCTK